MNNQWRFKGNEMKYLKEVIDSGEASGTSGGMNQRFEKLFAEKVGAKYAVSFNSGTGTLHAALDSLGVGYGDEVIIPPLTVISNIDVVLAQNAIPVFADIDPKTFNMDPKDVEKKITSKTKAIMPVSLYGVPCDLEAFQELADRYSIGIINDAAQAHGATYKGKMLGEFPVITSYSTENSKHISTGDGGIVVTNDIEQAELMRKFGSLGYRAMKATDGRVRLNKTFFQDPTYKRHDAFAYNYRMPEVAAAVGLAQTERFNEFVSNRQKIGSLFTEVMQGCDFFMPQMVPENCISSVWTFAARFTHPDVTWYEFRDKFIDNGGESIFAAWALLYDEPLVTEGHFKARVPELYDNLIFEAGLCPNAELVQPQLMQFIANYEGIEEAKVHTDALFKTIRFFQ